MDVREHIGQQLGRERTRGEVLRWALAVASVAAAAIHFSVIGEHYHEAWYFGVFLAVVAWAQLGWAIAVVVARSRRVLVAGAALQLGVVVIYLLSRTTGLPVGPEPWHAEAVAFLDVVCTVLEVVAGLGAALLAVRPLERPISGRAVLATASALFLVVAATTSSALALSGNEMNMAMGGMDMATMANGSTSMASMGSGHGGSLGTMGSMDMAGTSSTTMAGMTGMSGMDGSSSTTMAGMAGSSSTTMAGMAGMGGGGSTSTTMDGMPGMGGGGGDGSFSLATDSPAGDITWPMMAMTMETGMAMAGPACTTTPTAAQQAAAVSLVNTTVAATAKYKSLAAAKAAGFVPITPTGAAVVHYINWTNLDDTVTPAEVLNPSAPQSLVYANTSTGPRLVAAMYVMPNGSTATPPQPGGCLTQWHIHTNLCFNPGHVVVGVTDSSGHCPAGSTNMVTQPMLHVWLAPVPGGPLMVDEPDSACVTAASALPVEDLPPARA